MKHRAPANVFSNQRQAVSDVIAECRAASAQLEGALGVWAEAVRGLGCIATLCNCASTSDQIH